MSRPLFVKTTSGWVQGESVWQKTKNGWVKGETMAVKTGGGWQNTIVPEWIWKEGNVYDPTHYQYWSTNPNLIQNEGDCYGYQEDPNKSVFTNFYPDRCTQVGTICSECGGTYETQVYDHDWGEWEDYTGNTRQRICKRGKRVQGDDTTHFQHCGNLSNPDNERYFSHNFTQATKKDAINHVCRCERCDFEQEERHDSLGGYIPPRDPTCEGFGSTGGYMCSKCSYTTNIIIPPTGHDYTNASVFYSSNGDGTHNATQYCQNGCGSYVMTLQGCDHYGPNGSCMACGYVWKY